MNSSSYILLTGATGLLGRFLLRDLSQMGRKVAVLVRDSPTQTSRQRVEQLLRGWKAISNEEISTPVIINGELTRADLGIDGSTTKWIAENVSDVLHSAASLSFTIKNSSNEPFATNVEGTRHLLDFCIQSKIQRFHHISTAYVCGDRTERILESELETGQASSNAYEKSKIEAELLVRNASLPNPPTILRPSIVVGDFLDGFTSSFHGFYVPLKFIQAFASSFAKTALDPRDILNSFNLDGNSHKNFVSVDWVSAAISRIMLDTSLHGKTYHLTSDKPTPLERVSTVFAEMLPGMINNQPKALMPNELETISLQSLADKFLEAMEPYKSYWRDDPKFDKSNTDYAIPGFNAPVLDAPALRRLTKFALDHNFRPIDSMTRQPI